MTNRELADRLEALAKGAAIQGGVKIIKNKDRRDDVLCDQSNAGGLIMAGRVNPGRRISLDLMLEATNNLPAILTALRAPTYAEGAEAMREAAAVACETEANACVERRDQYPADNYEIRSRIESQGRTARYLAHAIHALPLPEPKP